MAQETITALGAVVIALAVYLGLTDDPRANKTTRRIEITITIEATEMGFGIDTVLTGLIGAGAGLWGQKQAAETDYQNQLRLMQKQQEMGQQNAAYNQGLALQMWKDTNYAAQREQMEKAGLNVGLMYGKGGGGGATTGSPGGNQPTISQSPKVDPGMALQQGMQMAMQQAQIDNIKADTDKKKAEVGLTEAQEAYTIQLTGNAEVDGKIKTLQEELTRIEKNVQGATAESRIESLMAASREAIARAELAGTQNEIAKKTADEVVEQTKLATIQAGFNIKLSSLELVKGGEEIKNLREERKEIGIRINKMVQDTAINWASKDQKDKELAIRQALAGLESQRVAFETSDQARAQQWMRVLLGTAELASAINGKGGTQAVRVSR